MKTLNVPTRAAAAAAALAMVLAACGGGTLVASEADDAPPAAVIVGGKKAKELVPTPAPVAEPSPSASVTAPTGFARPERVEGPPGNPVAQNFSDPPAPGRYPYRIIVQGSFGQDEDEFQIEQFAARSGRQVEFWDIPDFPQEFTYRWTPDRLLLEKVKSTGIDGQTVECNFDPPSLVMKLPMNVGATWEDESECDGQTSTSRSEVIRTERVEVGGAQVDTFVIETVSEGEGQTTTATRWYAPGPRLTVIFEQVVESESFGSFETIIEALSIEPVTG